jgi:hypothetical protein
MGGAHLVADPHLLRVRVARDAPSNVALVVG